MSWQPPASFTPDVTARKKTRCSPPPPQAMIVMISPKKKKKSEGKGTHSRRAEWAPSFVVGMNEAESEDPDHSGRGVVPPEESVLLQEGRIVREQQQAISSAYESRKSPSMKGSGAGTHRPTPPKKVGWNQALFVVDQENGPIADKSTTSSHIVVGDFRDDDRGESEIQISSPISPSGCNNIFLSKREHLVVDQAMLRTRLEWSQLLVRKAFKPYRQSICEMDDDLPSPDDISEMEESASNEDYLEGKNELIKIRDEMLVDPDLSEREIAAFFEGYKLLQMKVNSLQSQLDGIRAMKRLSFHSSFVCTRHTRSERVLPATEEAPSPPNHSLSTITTQNLKKNTRISSQRLSSVDEEIKEESTTCVLSSQTPSLYHIEAHERSTSQSLAKMRLNHGVVASRSLRQMSIQRIRDATSEQGGSEDIRKLLEELEEAERRQKKLEKQLAKSGVVIAEDIPFDVAKQKVETIARRMGEIGGSDVGDRKLQEEYYVLEREMDKYMTALQLSDEWIAEQEQLERRWEESIMLANEEAIKKLRRHMPVDVRNRSEGALTLEPSPNGKYLDMSIAKKFKRTNVLQLLRVDPDDIVPMHAATLENLRVTGLTLTERRALYCHLKYVGQQWKAMQGDKMTERKWTWFNMMKTNFKENLDVWLRHIDRYGPPGNHPYATRENPHSGCPLVGNQCPLKADRIIDYDGDYGYPDGPVYLKSEVKKFEADNVTRAKQEANQVLKQKKSEERRTALKEHYSGKLLQVALANGSCEAMDEAIDRMEDAQEKWIKAHLSKDDSCTDESKRREVTSFYDALNELKLSILQFAQRSGMKLTGKRDSSNADQLDGRSMIEVSLCDEVVETAFYFFGGIEDRMAEIQMEDGRVKVTIHQLRTLLEELQERNHKTIQALRQERAPRSRELKSRSLIKSCAAKALEKEKQAEASKEVASNGPPSDIFGRGSRGDLLSALHGRDDRGGLLAAVAARGNR